MVFSDGIYQESIETLSKSIFGLFQACSEKGGVQQEALSPIHHGAFIVYSYAAERPSSSTVAYERPKPFFCLKITGKVAHRITFFFQGKLFLPP